MGTTRHITAATTMAVVPTTLASVGLEGHDQGLRCLCCLYCLSCLVQEVDGGTTRHTTTKGTARRCRCYNLGWSKPRGARPRPPLPPLPRPGHCAPHYCGGNNQGLRHRHCRCPFQEMDARHSAQCRFEHHLEGQGQDLCPCGYTVKDVMRCATSEDSVVVPVLSRRRTPTSQDRCRHLRRS